MREDKGPNHLLNATCALRRAKVNQRLGDHRAALPDLHACLDIRRKQLGPKHFRVAEVLFALSRAYHAIGKEKGRKEGRKKTVRESDIA